MQRGRYVQLMVLASVPALLAGAIKPANAGFLNLALDQAQYIGTPANGGSATVQTGISGSPTDAVYTLTGLGADIQGTGDNFEFAYTSLAGDGGITARLLSQTGGDKGGWFKSGVMLRETTEPGSLMAAVHLGGVGTSHATAQVETLYRQKAKTNPVGASNQNRDLANGPIWLRAQRQGQSYQLLVSNDGNNWMLLGDKALTVDATKPVLAGVTSTAHGKPALVATFDNVTVNTDLVKPNLLPGPTNIMAQPGSGVVLLTFSTVPNGVGYNVYRREVGQTADQAVLVSKTPTPNGWFVDNTVENGKQYLYFLKTLVPDAANPKKAMAEGLAASSDVLVAPNAAIPSNLPGVGYQFYYWNTTNPGGVDLGADGVLTVKSSGSDIWSVADSGSFLAAPVAGDYTISAKVLELPKVVGNTDKFAKAGVMVRDGVNPTDRYAIVFTSAGRDPGVLFESRTNNRVGLADSVPGLVGQSGSKFADTKFPLWLKLTKKGSTVAAAESFDGATYTDVGTPVEFGYLPPVTYAGLALTAHKDGAFITAKFDAASVKIQQ